jgi:tetratricopeptide (TPR) repeat protein
MRRRDSLAFVVAVALSFATLVGVGCSERPVQPCVCEQSPAVDAPLMAFLSKARSAHHQADLREQAGDTNGAVEALEKVVDSTAALGERAEVREVQSDTLARLSDLRGQQGDHDAAERDVRKGLELSPKGSYFEGHLYEMRGVNEERRAKARADAGDEPGAQAARRQAFQAFERAIEIQDGVIRKELTEDAGERR